MVVVVALLRRRGRSGYGWLLGWETLRPLPELRAAGRLRVAPSGRGRYEESSTLRAPCVSEDMNRESLPRLGNNCAPLLLVWREIAVFARRKLQILVWVLEKRNGRFLFWRFTRGKSLYKRCLPQDHLLETRTSAARAVGSDCAAQRQAPVK
jgi:hypothetical protein